MYPVKLSLWCPVGVSKYGILTTSSFSMKDYNGMIFSVNVDAILLGQIWEYVLLKDKKSKQVCVYSVYSFVRILKGKNIFTLTI